MNRPPVAPSTGFFTGPEQQDQFFALSFAEQIASLLRQLRMNPNPTERKEIEQLLEKISPQILEKIRLQGIQNILAALLSNP